MPGILIVEDSTEYSKLLVRTMGDYETTCVSTVDEALQALRNKTYDLVLLDIGLPNKDGYSLLAELQANESHDNPSVICLTAREQVTDKVTAFSLGADDYIVKPFDPIELRARVGAKLTKRRRSTQASVLRFGELEIDQDRHRVAVSRDSGVTEIPLTQTEFKLLTCLVKRPDQVYSRDQLLIAAWGEDARVLERVVDVHICSMRKKLGAFAKRIKAVPGLGYKFSSKVSGQAA